MNEFLQTFLIATIPSAITAFLSYLASSKASNTQIRAIKEQNKADIQKLVEQNRADIDKLKEQYKIQADMEEISHAHKLEIMKISSEIDARKDLANAIGDLVLSIINSFIENRNNVNDSTDEENNNLED